MINLHEIKLKIKSESELNDKVVINAIKDILKCYEYDVEVIEEDKNKKEE